MKQEFSKIVDFFAEEGCNTEIVCTVLCFLFCKGRGFGKTSKEQESISVIIGVIQLTLQNIRTSQVRG